MNIKKIFSKKKYFRAAAGLIFLAVIFIFPQHASGQVVSFHGNKTNYAINDNILVVVYLDTMGKTINAIEATIQVPADFFDISNIITTDDSIFSLWPEMPTIHDDGTITFTGGVPHGFNGPKGAIFEFSLKAKKAGAPDIFVKSAKILLNDGRGTEAKNVKLIPLAFSSGQEKTAETNEPETGGNFSYGKIIIILLILLNIAGAGLFSARKKIFKREKNNVNVQ